MIRRPVEPSVWWAYAALVIGFVASLAMWGIQFGGHKIWTLDNGQMMRLGWGPATLCLWPWKVLACREMFTLSGISDLGPITRYQMTVYVPALIGIVVFGFGWNNRYGRRPKLIILEGPAVSDFEALKVATARESKNKVDCLPLFGDWSLPPLRQSLGIMMIGQPGSGKTNFLRYLTRSISDRGDRMVIFAYKTNVYSYTPPVKPTEACADEDPILINPADDRSWIWDIAKDVDGDASAASIARRLVAGKK